MKVRQKPIEEIINTSPLLGWAKEHLLESVAKARKGDEEAIRSLIVGWINRELHCQKDGDLAKAVRRAVRQDSKRARQYVGSAEEIVDGEPRAG